MAGRAAPHRGPGGDGGRHVVRDRSVILIANAVSVRSLSNDELATTKVGHDAAFLGALRIIQGSGIPGSVLTVPGVAKWTRALLVRDAYFPNLAARYTFDPTHLIDEETTYFALTDRVRSDERPRGGHRPRHELDLGERYVRLPTGLLRGVHARGRDPRRQRHRHGCPPGQPLTDGVAERVTSGGTVRLAPNGSSSFSLTYTGTGFVLTVTAVAETDGPDASILVNAAADPGFRLLGLEGNLTSTLLGSSKFEPGAGHGPSGSRRRSTVRCWPRSPSWSRRPPSAPSRNTTIPTTRPMPRIRCRPVEGPPSCR